LSFAYNLPPELIAEGNRIKVAASDVPVLDTGAETSHETAGGLVKESKIISVGFS